MKNKFLIILADLLLLLTQLWEFKSNALLRDGLKISSQSYIVDVGATSSRNIQVWEVISYPFFRDFEKNKNDQSKLIYYGLINEIQ